MTPWSLRPLDKPVVSHPFRISHSGAGFPFYPLGFALFPVLALLAVNIRELDPRVAVRPLLIAVSATGVVLAVLRAVLGSWHKAALLTTGLLVLFFSYGHLYGEIRNAQAFGFVFGRHRYLFPALGLLFVAFAWWVIRRAGTFEGAAQVLNLTVFALLILPLMQLGSYTVQARLTRARIEEVGTGDLALTVPASGELRDIYYIVLDTYTRADALERDFGFDNRPFLDALRELGFYVAECSRSNYGDTNNSIAAALNMQYMVDLSAASTLLPSDPSLFLRDSLVRQLLEDIGYKTIAFDTGYEWSRLKDADIYLSLTRDPIMLQRLDPFESMLVDSTAAAILADREVQSFAVRAAAIDDIISEADNPHAGYVESQLFILDQLPEIAALDEPTLAIVHILIPHVPYVFNADGEVWSDPDFYSGERAEPIDELHWQIGYTSEIQFINQQMLEILEEILNESKNAPIIVMHGDHGLRGENRLQILNSYYLPDIAGSLPYPSISPVNSFRLIFDRYFGTDFGFIEDLSYFEIDHDPPPETSDFCKGSALDSANLEGATLSMHATGPHYAEADLRDASLSEANLLGARVRDEQLVNAKALWRATMSYGTTYDGRYNLEFDREVFPKSASDPGDPNEWAFFYGVSLAEYENGQQWADAHKEMFDNEGGG